MVRAVRGLEGGIDKVYLLMDWRWNIVNERNQG